MPDDTRRREGDVGGLSDHVRMTVAGERELVGPSIELKVDGPWPCSMCGFEYDPVYEGLEDRFYAHVADQHPEYASRRKRVADSC